MGAHQSGTRCPFERRKSPTYQNPAFLSDKDKAQITGKEFGKCFEKSELSMLDGLFKEISHPHQLKGTRKEIKVLDKITFLRLFKVPGLLGERLFAVFDTKHQGVIDYDEFIAGLAIYCRGSTEDKLKMLFDMYDVTGTGAVSREELTTMLFSLITPTHYFFQPQSTSISTHKDSLVPSTSSNTSQKLSHEISDPSMNASTTSSSSNSSSNSDHSVTQPTLSESSSSTDSSPGILARRIAARIADRDTSPSPQPEIHEDTQQDSWGHMDREFRSLKVMDDHQLVETIVKDAFEKCDTSKDGKLQFDEFVELIRTTPTIVEALEKAFVFQYWNDHHIKNKKKSRSPVLSGKTSPKHSRHGSLATSHHNMKVNSLTMPASAFPMKKSLTSDLNSDTSKPAVLRSTSQGSGLVPPINNIPTSRSFGSLADLQPRTLHLSPSANHMIEGATVYCPDCGFQLRFCHKCGHQLIIQSLSNITCTGSCGTSTQEYENCTQCGKQLQQTSSSLPLLQSPVNGMSSPGRSVVPPIANTVAASADDIINENLYHAGTLYKQSKYLKRWKTRWSVLRHNILYIFQDSNELHCSHALFMESQFVDIPTIQEYAKDGYYSFQLTNCRSKVTRTYYAKSEKERDGWVTVLRQSAKTTGIESRYELGKQIGKGKFSTVVEAKHIETHEMYAVKVIDKTRVCQDPMELEALRTEIAILKLIDHPYVVKMRELFVSKSHLYIVMDLLRGGDLFDRLIQRGHFSETTTKQIVHKLLQAISYLHARGIVHRDLKPENILCISENDDSNIMIADFGLSKFATPTEVMNLPCGTLAYVAPEVLKLQGYGKSVDLWSIGIIGFLLLSGILPFDGSSKAQIIERTLHAKIHFDADVFKHVSADAKDVISRLLHKNPQQRMTVEEALAHPWFKDLPSRLSPRNRAIKG